jgi:hypothetical protein
MHKGWLVALAVPAFAGLVWIALRNGSEIPSSARSNPKKPPAEIATPTPVRAPAPAPSVANAPPKPAATAPFVMISPDNVATVNSDDSSSMDQLRELLIKDPELGLKETREALEREPDGPNAAEQTSMVVKALVGLGRFDEARREAEVMVKKFPGTRWAEDVERHVLTHPP